MIDIYIKGVLFAMVLCLLKVLAAPNYFQRFNTFTTIMGCFIYSLLSWYAVARILYYEVKRQLR